MPSISYQLIKGQANKRHNQHMVKLYHLLAERASMKTVYDMNGTMQILGKQRTCSIFWKNDMVKSQVKEIAQARPQSFTIDAAADIFMLGYIHGKRSERAKQSNCSTLKNKK